MNRQMEYATRLSPFRYPGGKAFLHGIIASHVEAMEHPCPAYVEPFAGGAGAALILLALGKVSSVHLNDADRCVYAAWKTILQDTDRFIDELKSRPVTIETWRACKHVFDNAAANPDEFEVGFATFFLNRTNRSGILRGAGPIGGYEQNGKWKIGARFYKETIVSRALALQKLADRIFLTNMDGLSFLRECSQKLPNDATFYFIDPPYVQAGSRLYLNTMTDKSHRDLAAFLRGGALRNWLLTYDDCDLVRGSYSSMGIKNVEVPYSLQMKRKEREVIVSRLSDRQAAVSI